MEGEVLDSLGRGVQGYVILGREGLAYNAFMERKIFWISFTVLGLAADFILPLWWALAATIPIVYVSWWIAYRSDWF
jgi:hypothetical protein